MADQRRDNLIRSVDVAIDAFNQDGRLSRGRATKRAGRVTGLDWTYSALLIMQGMKDNSMIRMTDLAELVGTTPPTVTKLIKDLEARGLVDRTADEQDGRVGIVGLTERGRQVAEALGLARIEALQRVLVDWSEEDLERLTVLFGRLRADMRRMS